MIYDTPLFLILILLCLTLQIDNILTDHIIFAKNDNSDSKEEDEEDTNLESKYIPSDKINLKYDKFGIEKNILQKLAEKNGL